MAKTLAWCSEELGLSHDSVIDILAYPRLTSSEPYLLICKKEISSVPPFVLSLQGRDFLIL